MLRRITISKLTIKITPTKLKLGFFIVSATLLHSAGQAMNYGECLDHSTKILRQAQTISKTCESMNSDSQLIDWARCNGRSRAYIAENACFPAMRANARVQHFLWQQEELNIQNWQRKQITEDQFDAQSKRIVTMMAEEQENYRLVRDAEYQRLNREVATRMEQRRLNVIISALGGITKSETPATSSRTYILGNRTIICNGSGNLIVCN